MSPAQLLSPGACFLAGLVTSLHCAGMCGPFLCTLTPAQPDKYPQLAAAYHVCRIGSYLCLGAAAGGLGQLPLSLLPEAILRFVPLVAVIFFLGLAFRWDRRWARPAALTRRIFAFIGPSRGRSQMASAATLGLLTPLLPCGPLYFFLGIALLSGSAPRGAELMLAFGLGTLPLLWIAQAQFARLQPKLSPLWLGRVRFCLALAAAAMAAWRARMAFPGGGAGAWLCF